MRESRRTPRARVGASTASDRRALVREASRSVDAPPALAPWFDSLFAGLSALGGSPRKAIRMLALAGFPRGGSIIDLGCGKGGAAVEAASVLRARVVGVDALPVFLDAARALAERRGLSARCKFMPGDARDAAHNPACRSKFDAALMLGVMPVAQAAPLARACVRPGGLYIIDDAYLDPRFMDGALPRAAATLERCRRVFSRLGDTLVDEWVPGPAAVRRQNAAILRRLRANARRLARVAPALRAPIAEFLRRQESATASLGAPFRPAVWVVRVGGARRSR